jgi:hypothetical protein
MKKSAAVFANISCLRDIPRSLDLLAFSAVQQDLPGPLKESPPD